MKDSGRRQPRPHFLRLVRRSHSKVNLVKAYQHLLIPAKEKKLGAKLRPEAARPMAAATVRAANDADAPVPNSRQEIYPDILRWMLCCSCSVAVYSHMEAILGDGSASI